MVEVRECIECGERADMLDIEYDEAYCLFHFNEWQRSSEPITNYRELNADA